MAVTTTRTKDEFQWLVANAVETAIATCLDTTLPYVDGTGTPATNANYGNLTAGTRRVTRVQVAKAIARSALRKATQPGMRPEVNAARGTTMPLEPVAAGAAVPYVKPI